MVGGQGETADGTGDDDYNGPRLGGYGGGGSSGDSDLWASGGGGGGSLLFGPSGSAPLIAAGGGGGATFSFDGLGLGGSGGGAGAIGTSNTIPGSGGTASDAAAGSAGPGNGGDPGVAGQGPTTGPSTLGTGGVGGVGGAVSGGGGGGGYFGGGGGGGSSPSGAGSGGPGGGGSGFAAAVAHDVNGAAGVRIGDGQIDITYAKATATVTVSAAPSSSQLGDPVLLTTTVAGSLGTPTGTVAFLADGLTITGCAAVPLDAAGTATCTTGDLSVGNRALTGHYSGDGTYADAEAGTSVTITQRPSTVTLTADPNSVIAGAAVTWTATVTGGDSPTGTIDFTLDGAAVLGCSAVPLDGAGVARCSTNAPGPGSFEVTAAYSGDAELLPSSASLTLVVVAPILPETGAPTGIGSTLVAGMALALAGLSLLGISRVSVGHTRRRSASGR